MLQLSAIKEPTVEMIPAIKTCVALNALEWVVDCGEAGTRATTAPVRSTPTSLYYHPFIKIKAASPSFSAATAFQAR